MRAVLAGLSLFALAACADGRPEPGGSLFDPLCMPDGSVVFYEYPNKAGQFDEVTANKQNCVWNKKS